MAKLKEKDQNQNKEDYTPKSILIEKYLSKRYEFYFDEILQESYYRQIGAKRWKPLDDREVSSLTVELDKRGFKSFESILVNILKSSTFIPTRNPVKEYFLSLEDENIGELTNDDGDLNLTKVSSLIILQDPSKESYLKKHLVKFMVRCIRSVFEPTYFNKQALILSGEDESVGKSHFFERLVPKPFRDKYYQPNIRLDTYVDTMRCLANNFIVNLEEIERHTRTKDASNIKAIVSQNRIKVRLTNAKRDSILARLASFVGSCNESNFLRSGLGSSRWIAFQVEGVKWMGESGSDEEREIEKVMRLAWIEAYRFYRKDNKYGELTREELNVLRESAENFTEISIEQELTQKYFLSSVKGEGEFLTTTDIMLYLQEQAPRAKLNKVAVGRALSKLEFSKSSKRINSKLTKGYYVKKIQDTPLWTHPPKEYPKDKQQGIPL